MKNSERSKSQFIPIKTRAVLAMVFVTILSLVLTKPATAQLLYGTLAGNVVDPSGAAVPDATVVATEVGVNFSKTVVTNSTGFYIITDLPPGTYTVDISAANFRKTTSTGVVLRANQQARIDASLAMGDVTQTIAVSAVTAQLQTDRADVSNEISSQAVANLPTTSSVGRNVMSLYRLVPGATPPAENNSAGSNPQRAMNSNINGVSGVVNAARIDGVLDTYPYLPNDGAAYVPPQDAVENVNVVTSTYNADQGSVGGGAINFTIKSGTNKLHGSAYEYNSISQFNARNYFQTPAVLPRIPKYIYNQFGFSVGGPIIKNKLFFFGDWDRTRIRKTTSGTASVPTAALRRGDFSGAVDAQGHFLPIYDPTTGTPTGQNKHPFAGNQVPVSSAAATLLQTIPLPNTNGTSQLNNYFGSSVYEYNLDHVDFKTNYNPTSATTVFGRYSASPSLINDPPMFGNQGQPWDAGSPGRATGLIQNIGVGLTHLVTSNLFFDVNGGYTRQHIRIQAPDLALGDYGTNVLKIPGTNNNGQYLAGGIPGMGINNYASLGNNNGSSPNLFRDNQYTANINGTYVHGQHVFRAGAEILHVNINHFQLSQGNPRGSFSFTGGSTAQYGATATSFNSFADFLIGQAQSVNRGTQTEDPATVRWSGYSAYVQDTWQLRKNLTISYGIRYEIYPLPYGDHFGVLNFDPSHHTTVTDATGTHDVGTVLVGGKNGIPYSAGIQNGHGMIVPRLGIAYRVSDKTVVRSGFGITVDPDKLQNQLNVYPSAVALTKSGTNSYVPGGSFVTGIPPLPVPSLDAGTVALPYNVGTWAMPQDFRRGYIQSWSLAVQQEFPASLIANIAYIGNQSVRAQTQVNINASSPGGGQAGRLLNVEYGTPSNPHFNDTDITSQMPFRGSSYNGLQAQLSRNIPKSASFGVIYTWSKAINYADNGVLSTLIFAYPTYWNRNRALAGYDRTNNFQWWAITPLPFGADRKFLQRGITGAILGGWQLQTVLSWISGTPFTITSSATALNAPGNTQVADQLVSRVHILGGHGPGRPYFDTSDFAVPIGARFGTAGRNSVRGPGVFNLDAGIKRVIPLYDRFALELQAEAFDLTNTPQFANPASTVSTPSNFGIITSSNASRTLRLSGRITF